MIRRICRRLRKYAGLIGNSIAYLRYRDPLVVSAWVKVDMGRVVPRNWGDDINVFLFERITGRKVIVRGQSPWHGLFSSASFICIGSILGLYETRRSIVWGSGAISPKVRLKAIPAEIRSVRGPRTRELIESQGISCPERYGDPALLLSMFYRPSVVRKYRCGIIPHYTELDNPLVSSFVGSDPDCILINMEDYDVWTDVIDKICSCGMILSSSLHGLIVADSYGIPNRWLLLSDDAPNGSFKYMDYFESVGRTGYGPVRVAEEGDFSRASVPDFGFEQLKTDFRDILDACPFRDSIKMD